MKQIPNDSLLAVLTCAELPPRNHPLSQHCTVICLSRVVRSLPQLYVDGSLREMTRMKAGNVGQLDGGKFVNMRKTGGP